MTGAGFPHSDIHGSKLGRQLPVAFRSHPRPSSAIRRQGIHRWLFVAWKNKDARARYGILKGRSAPNALTEATHLENGTADGTEPEATSTGRESNLDRPSLDGRYETSASTGSRSSE